MILFLLKLCLCPIHEVMSLERSSIQYSIPHRLKKRAFQGFLTFNWALYVQIKCDLNDSGYSILTKQMHYVYIFSVTTREDPG
jgi:hypothetical protein